MLITSLFPDTPRAANALISYNNRGVGEAVPFFEELIVPLFSDVDKNGSEFIKAMINVARMQINGTFVVVFICCVYMSLFICSYFIFSLYTKHISLISLLLDINTKGKVPSDDALLNLLRSTPTPFIPTSLKETLISPSLVTIPQPLRDSLTSIITEPTYKTLNTTGIPTLLTSSLDITQQIPKLIDEVEGGARDFVPTPDAMSSAARRAYRCRRTLLLQFTNDNLDDSEILEGYLKEAESVMKMKRPMITINLERKVLDGNHLTPLLGPSGGESWGEALEETFGSVLGGSGSSSKDSGEEGGGEGEDISSSNAKAVRQKLRYDQVENVVDELVAWLDEGSL